MVKRGNFGERLKRARTNVVPKMSQEELARLINFNQTTVSDWENGEQIPVEMVARIAKATNDPALVYDYAVHMEMNVLNMPRLNNVDDHVMTVLNSLIKEMSEAIDAVHELILIFRNKRSRADFDKYEWHKVKEHIKQIGDVQPALMVYFIAMARDYDLDLDQINLELTEKYVSRGYVKGE